MQTYIQNLQALDYVAYSLLVGAFFVLLILSILLSRRAPITALILIFLSFIALLGSPYFIKLYLDKKLRASSLELNVIKRLTYTDVFIINGSLTNLSKIDFNSCEIKLRFFKSEQTSLSQKIKAIKPIYKLSYTVENPPKSGETIQIDKFFENINFDEKTQSVKYKAECY